jgi:hypothetical protein
MSRHPRVALQRDIDALDLGPLLIQLRCDHAGRRELIAQLDEVEPQDVDVCVAQLAACLLPHLDAERQELFPRLRCSALALGGLGLQIAARIRALQADITRQSIPATPRWTAARLAA